MKKNYFISGEFNVTCDVCSKKIKAHEAKHRWDGLIVCTDDWEPRHEQDFVKTHTDKITVPFNRPIPALAFNHLLPIFEDISLTDDALIQIISTFARDFTDIINTSELVAYSFTKNLTDSIGVMDNIQVLGNGAQLVNDVSGTSDNGSILFSNYVDVTYVDTSYVGTIVTF